jgi:hypothetical protein
MNESAIQNLDFLRKLIADTRREAPAMDMAKLRMRQSDIGTGKVEAQQGDR